LASKSPEIVAKVLAQVSQLPGSGKVQQSTLGDPVRANEILESLKILPDTPGRNKAIQAVEEASKQLVKQKLDFGDESKSPPPAGDRVMDDLFDAMGNYFFNYKTLDQKVKEQMKEKITSTLGKLSQGDITKGILLIDKQLKGQISDQDRQYLDWARGTFQDYLAGSPALFAKGWIKTNATNIPDKATKAGVQSLQFNPPPNISGKELEQICDEIIGQLELTQCRNLLGTLREQKGQAFDWANATTLYPLRVKEGKEKVVEDLKATMMGFGVKSGSGRSPSKSRRQKRGSSPSREKGTLKGLKDLTYYIF